MYRLLILISLCSCVGLSKKTETTPPKERIQGVSFVGTSHPAEISDFQHLATIGSNYITLMPFAYGSEGNSELKFNGNDWQWWGESVQGIESCIQMASEQGIQCMIKPHIWFHHGFYTGHFELSEETDWIIFEQSYTEYVMEYAQLSAKYNLPILCIGTELDKWVQLRPQYWLQLIKDIRQGYHGKLTYASNWDNSSNLQIWSQLDFVGIDAYYPVCDMRTPDENSLRNGWRQILDAISIWQMQIKKPIIFTEWGYQCMDFCAREPWNYELNEESNELAQANCYRVLLEECEKHDWFSGGFVWKWFPGKAKTSSHHHDRFSPQGKIAEQVLRDCFLSN